MDCLSGLKRNADRWNLSIVSLLFVLELFLLGLIPLSGICGDYEISIEKDWENQEKRAERKPIDLNTIQNALQRGELLGSDLTSMPNPPNLEQERSDLKHFQKQLQSANTLDENARLELYKKIRWTVRKISLKNPLIASKKIVFMKRKRFICQMLHEYLGYFYDYKDISGGSVCILENPGYSTELRDLISDRLPRGNYTTLSLSYNAKTVYFAFSERAEQKPNYYTPERKGFHIYAVDSDGSNLRQITRGLYDDFDPCELPDGDIAFMSTRRGGFGRCHNPWEPLPTYTLHRVNTDGNGARTLSFHETNEWHPSVLQDGRIIYTRWDYVDRSAANFHGLWTSNPDGSNPSVLFGNYTEKINACYQAKAIPNSNKIVFVAGAHHADVGGSLVLLDPARISLNTETGEDDFSSLEFLTPEVTLPEAPDWPVSFYHSPWPLSENYYLVAFSFDPLPGMGPKVDSDSETGIYLFDRFGNMELLYREKGVSCMYPVPLAPRTIPPVIPSALNTTMGQEGEFMLTDVNQSLMALPKDRPVHALRIFQVFPKSETHVANKPRLGYANAESARMLLGTVPVEEDGSAYFRAPAGKPLVFQAIDKEGKAVQGMRSLTYLQPGERRGCTGCHESPGTVAKTTRTKAFQRKPSVIQPGPDGSQPWSFPRLMQPMLDTQCIRCHDGSEKSYKPNLTGTVKEEFTVSYENLRPYIKWNEWGGESINGVSTKPEHMPADCSPLVKILDDANHKDAVHFSKEDKERLYLWLDGNASFYGAYSPVEQLAQLKGEAIQPPELQ